MGGSHSRSEDLRKRTFLTSDNYIDSLQEVPGYFTKTQQTVDFLDEDLSAQMSYNGPPSHLQHSSDVHPFLDRFGPNFLPRERFVDRSQNMDVPPSMLPSAESAREFREIEVRETMASLQLQVRETLDKKREQTPEAVDQSREDRVNTDLPTDEQNTLEFLDSIINESMDVDLSEENETESESCSEANWIMRDKSKTPVPGLMHSTVPPLSPPSIAEEESVSPKQPSSRPSSGFFRNSIFLPDTDPIHSPARSKQTPPPTKPKPANRRSTFIPNSVPPRDYPGHSPPSHPPVEISKAAPAQTPRNTVITVERVGSKNSSDASTEDMGIVMDYVNNEEGGGRNIDNNNLHDTKSRVKGVRALVSMYSDESSYSPTGQEQSFAYPAKDPFVGMQLPIRDYMFGNSNNSNAQRFDDGKPGEGSKTYGTMSSEDSALGDSSRDPVEDAVLGVIHSELQKLRMK